jgi:hypothetical protein
MVAPTLSARSTTASGSEVTTCSELVPARQGVLRSPVLDNNARPPSRQSQLAVMDEPLLLSGDHQIRDQATSRTTPTPGH